MNDNEKLIEDVAKAIWDADTTIPETWDNKSVVEWDRNTYRAMARAALAVFEKAHTPTDDEREAAMARLDARAPYSTPEAHAVAQRSLARSLASEPQGEPSDAVLDAVFAAFRAHDRGEEFNELREHVCSECGYAYSWPGAYGRQEVPARRRQRHIAREALRAAGGAR